MTDKTGSLRTGSAGWGRHWYGQADDENHLVLTGPKTEIRKSCSNVQIN